MARVTYEFEDKIKTPKGEKWLTVTTKKAPRSTAINEVILFDLNIEYVFASDINPVGKSNELLVDILKKVGATRYLSGVGALDYYDPAPYDEAGIEVVFQEFEHPIYPQLHGEFTPYLSSIDLLFNCGIEKSREILRSI